MRFIFKNYLKTFVKNWVQTIGTILFIMMMVTIVIGMLSAPLQITTIINNYRSKNMQYNSFLMFNERNKSGDFSNKFLYSYVYHNSSFDGKDEHGNDVEIIAKNSTPILSTAYKVSLDNYLKEMKISDQVELENSIGAHLNEGINTFKQGALIPLKIGLVITDEAGNKNKQNFDLVIDNLTELLATDYNISLDQGYDSNETMYRLGMKALALFNNNNIPIDFNELRRMLPSVINLEDQNFDLTNQISDNQIKFTIKALLNSTFNQILAAKPPKFEWTFSTIEFFDAKIYKELSWKPHANSYEDYSYDFNNFILAKILNNPDNKNFYNDRQGFRYKIYSEKDLYIAENTTDSLFPKFAIEFKTSSLKNEVNQLQLEKGTIPSPIGFRELAPKNIASKKIPTIVMSSAFIESNKLSLDDTINIPESSAKNNLLLANRLPTDSFLTGQIPFRIVGYGSKFDDLVPGKNFIPFLEDIENYAIGYVDPNLFSVIRNSRWNYNSINEKNFSSKIMVKNLWSNNDRISNELTINSIEGLTVYSTNSFKDFKQSQTMQNLNTIQIMVTVFIILGIVVLILSFVFINFIIKKELNETRRQIGIFKSFGYKISELSWIFAIKTFITIFVGIVLGLIMSVPLQLYVVRLYTDQITFQFAHVYMNGVFLSFLLVVIPLIFLALSYSFTFQYLREPVLSLLSNGGKISKWTVKPSRFIKYLSQKNKWFEYRLQRAFIRRSMGKFVVVQTLFAFSSLAYTLMFGAQTLLFAFVNQGFSALNPATDHEFGWKNKSELNITSGQDKFNIRDPERFKNQKFDYISYDANNSINKILNDEKTNASDSRYRISLVIDSYANAFNLQNEDKTLRETAMDWLLPQQYYFDKYVYQPEKEKDAFVGKNALKILNSDYYLNWFFTLKIDMFDEKSIDLVKENLSPNFKEVINEVNSHEDMRIDLTPALKGEQDAIKKIEQEFPRTILGIKAVDKGLKNNIFLEDITKIVLLQLAEQNFDQQIDQWLKNNASTSSNGWYRQADVERAIIAVKNDKLGLNFDPNDVAYWGLTNNALIDLDKITKDKDNDTDSIKSGLSLSKLPPETISIIMSALMLEKHPSNDINDNSIITMNQLFYNPDKELLTHELMMSNANQEQIGGLVENEWINLRMIDTSSKKYGMFNNVLSHKGVSDDVYKQLGDAVYDDDTINGVLPYGLAKTYNIKKGDTFSVLTNTVHRKEIKIKVIGINQDVSFYLGTGWPIDVDFNQFREKFYSSELNFLHDSGLPIFNKLYSQEPLLTGNIDINNIPKTINTMRFVGKNLSMSIDNDASIFGTVFKGLIDFSRIFNIPIDSNFYLLTNPNIASNAANSYVIPYNILRSGVDNLIGIVDNVIILFMVLLAMLLLIILVVIMNIIVEEAASIILTLRAIGYNNFEVNWTVMGSYIVGAICSFVIAYILSLIIWVVFLEVVGNLTHIYVFMKFSWQAPVVTFLVIGSILTIGWAAADYRVNKTPLPQITSF